MLHVCGCPIPPRTAFATPQQLWLRQSNGAVEFLEGALLLFTYLPPAMFSKSKLFLGALCLFSCSSLLIPILASSRTKRLSSCPASVICRFVQLFDLLLNLPWRQTLISKMGIFSADTIIWVLGGPMR